MSHFFYKSLMLTALLGCASTAAMADDSSPAYDFLNITSSTRAYGLGGVNITTVDNDINIVGQNPALLGPEFDLQVGVNYMRWLGESNFAGATVGGRADSHSGWAGFVQYYGYGDFKEADNEGNITGKFSAKDLVFGGMYSRDITERLRGGVALKMVYSAYAEYSAFALATDIGINYYNPERDLSLSAVVTNLGGQVKRFNDSYDRLPIDVRLGWAKSFGNLPVRFSVTAWNLTKWHLPYVDSGDGSADSSDKIKDSFGSNLFRHLIFGADFIPSDKFHIGIGYNYKTRTDMSTYARNILSGFSIGAGLKVRGFNIGIAYAQPHSDGSTFMFNVSSNLSEFLRK